jgi:protease II
VVDSCKPARLNCDGGEAILFSMIGKSVLQDSICAVCPDGSQYHLLSKPGRGQSFLFVHGDSLRRPLVVTVHSHLLDNRTEDHLYLLDTDDGMLHAIPKLNGQQAVAALSPDGSQVAYESEIDPQNPLRLAVTNLKSGETALLPIEKDEFDRLPTWSPDSKELMFVRLHLGKRPTVIESSLMRVPVPLDKAETIFGPQELVGSAAYAPDGRRFAIWSINGLEIVERGTLKRTVIYPTRSLGVRHPGSAGLIWARRSNTLAFTLFNSQTSASELWAVHESGKGGRLIFTSQDSTLYVGSFVDQ